MQKYHDEPKQYKGYLKSALIPHETVNWLWPRSPTETNPLRVCCSSLLAMNPLS